MMHEFMSSQGSIVIKCLDSEQRFEFFTCDSQSLKHFRTSDSLESRLQDTVEMIPVSEQSTETEVFSKNSIVAENLS